MRSVEELKRVINEKVRIENQDVKYPEDCNRIKKVLAGEGIEVSVLEAEKIWDYVSGEKCSQWLFLPYSDYELFQEIVEMCDE